MGTTPETEPRRGLWRAVPRRWQQTAPVRLVEHLLQLKFIRYSMASAVAVVCGQAMLWFLAAGLEWPGVAANLGSVAVGTVPNYLINRYWTWQQSGRNRLFTEIVPFWSMAFLGTVLSTLAVAYADDRWGTPLAMSIAQLSGFGVLWFARFIILDKVMWRVVQDLSDAEDEGGTAGDDEPVGDSPTSGSTAGDQAPERQADRAPDRQSQRQPPGGPQGETNVGVASETGN